MAKFSVIFFVLCTLLVLQLATAHPADDNQSKENKDNGADGADAASGLSGMFGGIPKEVADKAKQAGEDAGKAIGDAVKAGKDKLDEAAQKMKF